MDTIATVEKQLGLPGLFTAGLYDKYGPQWAGRRILQDCWKHKPAILQECSFDLRDLPFGEAAAHIVWRRKLRPHMVGWYVHHYDKNSQYLSADRGMYTGVGDPVHVDGEPEKLLPGIYRVEATNVMATFGLYLPEVIEHDQKWVTLDILKFARKNGYEVEVLEAWVFPKKDRVLDEWADRLWKARVALKGTEHHGKIKMIATTSNGAWNWNQSARPWGGPKTVFIHPNWWADTVGKARTAVLANLLSFGSPVLIEIDGLYYITRNPDYRTAVLHQDTGVTIIARENESGGYKHKASFQLTHEIYERSHGKNAGQLAELFKEASK